jgi:NADP-dependent 3-hydroxy acid dehydrogenase YdfG
MFFGSKEVTKGQDPSNFVYLITGTDSGFGLLSSIALAKQGTFVLLDGWLTGY